MTIQLGATIFIAAIACYLAASVAYLIYLGSGRLAAGKAGKILLVVALLAHTMALVARTAVTHRPPFLNLYEYMLSFIWGAALIYLALEWLTKNRSYGAFAVPLITIFAVFASLLPSAENPTMPALRSAWRIPHIGSAILAYGAFMVAFVLAIIYLLVEVAQKNPRVRWTALFPKLDRIERSIYRTIAFGFLMQTLLIVVGAIWAQVAWGRFWGWDPKETWSLITWLIYAAYLHSRTMLGWRGRKAVIVALIGFPATLFTLFGVSFLLRGLHSYVR